MKAPSLLSAPWFTLLLRWLVGGVFIYAGALKIIDPAQFAISVSNYRILPHEAINLVAIVLPWIEVIAGLLLIVGMWTRASAFVIGAMTVMFFVLIASALARGLNIECGCFGTVGGRRVGLVSLGFDGVLVAMASWLSYRLKD